jgi:hypothetical protein
MTPFNKRTNLEERCTNKPATHATCMQLLNEHSKSTALDLSAQDESTVLSNPAKWQEASNLSMSSNMAFTLVLFI